MKQGLIIFIAGMVCGLGTMYYILYSWGVDEAEIAFEEVTKEDQSGAEISAENWAFRGKNIVVDIKAAGEGKAKFIIPKKLIPEANNWIERRHVIQFSLYFYANNALGSVAYLYRRGRVALGGGLIFSGKTVGVFISGQIYF